MILRLSLLVPFFAALSLGASIPCPIGQNLPFAGGSFQCRGLTFSGFTPVFYDLFNPAGLPTTGPDTGIDNTLLALQSITFEDGPGSPFVRLTFKLKEDLSNLASFQNLQVQLGFNFHLAGWSGGQPRVHGQILEASATFCRAAGLTSPESWVSCLDGRYLAYARVCLGVEQDPNGEPIPCPIASPESAGVLDGGSFDAAAFSFETFQASALPPDVTVRIYSLARANDTFTLDIPADVPEPGTAALLAAAGAVFAYRLRRK